MYFDDPEFNAALKELQQLLADKPAFTARYLTVNNLEQELANPAPVEQNQ